MEEIKKLAEEAIPQRYIDVMKEQHTRKVYNSDKGEYELDPNGNYVYKLDKKSFNNSLKHLASTFAQNGVDINQINFDEYKLDPGITLTKIPKNTLAFIEYGPDFYVIDKRSSTAGDNHDHWFNRTLRRVRDGKYVEAHRVPDSQFLQGGQNIWIIPEEILTRDIYKVRQERARAKNTGYPKRYKEFRDTPHYWKDEGPDLHLDKSGFLIDRKALKNKYKKMAEELRLKNIENNLTEVYEETLDKVINEFNTKVEKVFEIALRYFRINKSLGDFRNFTSEVDYAKRGLDDITDSYKWALKYLKNDQGETNQSSKEEIFKLIENLRNFFTKREGEGLENLYKKALALEGSFGGQSPSELQATESYFIPKKFNSALEGLGVRVMPKRKKE